MMKLEWNWRIFCISMTVASLLALALHAVSGLNFWMCLVMVVVGMVVSGIIAEIVDREPGGFLNPQSANGAEPPTRR